jgi:hypothetical protein
VDIDFHEVIIAKSWTKSSVLAIGNHLVQL